MKVIYGSYNEAYSADGNVVAIGNFDGLHRGHMEIINNLLRISKEKNLSSCVYTFAEHPINCFRGSGTLPMIADNEKKIALLEKSGVDTLFFEDFACVKDIEAEDFVKRILCDKLNAKAFVVGQNNRFGKNSEGDSNLLIKLGKKYDYGVCVVEPFRVDGEVCSSTKVREAIHCGDVEKAAKMLGYNFTLTGEITCGKKLGRTIGFPTANIIPTKEMLLPKNGVYATNAFVCGKRYKAITNVGIAPTVDDDVTRVETYIIDFDGDIYGKKIDVEFVAKIRADLKFRSLEALSAQLKNDSDKRLKMDK